MVNQLAIEKWGRLFLKVWVSFGCPLLWQNTPATEPLSEVQALEIKRRWWFSKVSYFYGSYKGQCCLSQKWPAKGKWKMCSTSTLSITMLHACNMRGIIFQKDLRVLWESLLSPSYLTVLRPVPVWETHYLAFSVEVIFSEIHITKIINNLWGATSKLASQIHSL